MKLLTFIMHTNIQQDMADELRKIDRVSGFTFSHVEGHGVQSEQDLCLSARDKVVGYTPRTRVDILLEDDDVQYVIDTLRNTTQSFIGKGIYYWVASVDENGRL